MAAPIIWNGKFAKLMANIGLRFNNGFRQHAIDVNPQVVSTEATKGDVLFSSSGIFQKQDDGQTTNWKKLNDIIPFKISDNFEMDTVSSIANGWVKYGNTNTALSYPDNFGGSASASSYVVTANNSLSGSNLFRLSLAATDNGKGVYKQFSITNGEKGLPFTIEFQTKITKVGSANWASNAQVWVVGSNDNFVSNFKNIPVTNNVITKDGLLKGSFFDDTASLTSFRLCIHMNGLTDTFNLDLDEVKVYQSANDTVSSIVSEWFDYPTASLGLFQGFGTPTSVSMKYRQVGDSYEIHGRFTCGTTTAVEARIPLPNGSIHASKNSLSTMIVGALNGTSGTTTSWSGYILADANNSYLRIGANQSSNDGLVAITANGWFNSGDQLSFFATVPIQGLNQFGSNVIASGENFMPIKASTNAQVVVATSTFVEVPFANNSNDSRFITSARVKLPTNARFSLYFKHAINVTPSAFACEIRKNGVAVSTGPLYQERSGTVAVQGWSFVIDTTGNLESDYYSLWFYQNSGGTYELTSGRNYIEIDRLDKPFSMNIFQAAGMILSPTDNVLPAKFKNSTTQSITASTLTVMTLNSTVFNATGLLFLDAVNSRIYNYGNDGYFGISLNAHTTCGTLSTHQVYIYKNGVLEEQIMKVTGTTSDDHYPLNANTTVFIPKNSYIDLRMTSSIASTLELRGLCINREDKTAVSAGGGYTKWQKKETTSSISATGQVTALTFNALEIGKSYRYTIKFNSNGNDGSIGDKILNVQMYCGASAIDSQINTRVQNVQNKSITACQSGIFTASSTTFYPNIVSISISYMESGAYLILEELPQHIQTNQWV